MSALRTSLLNYSNDNIRTMDAAIRAARCKHGHLLNPCPYLTCGHVWTPRKDGSGRHVMAKSQPVVKSLSVWGRIKRFITI